MSGEGKYTLIIERTFCEDVSLKEMVKEYLLEKILEDGDAEDG